MRKITRNIRLLKMRNKLIRQLSVEGFFIDEIGDIFRLQKARISQIVNKKERPKPKNN